MTRTIRDALFPSTPSERRAQLQEQFGRHLVEARNRMAAVVLERLAGTRRHPVPLVNRVVDQVRALEPATREAVARVVMDAADEIVMGILNLFASGNDAEMDGFVVNYAILAQIRKPESDEILEEVDINRGEPLVVIWNQYRKWLTRYCPSHLRTASLSSPGD